MKRFLIVSSLLISTVAFSDYVEAAPLYYTFSGTVTSASGNTNGLTAGSTVEYTFLLDFEENARLTVDGNVTYPWGDGSTVDTFYADYISGSALLNGAGLGVMQNFGTDNDGSWWGNGMHGRIEETYQDITFNPNYINSLSIAKSTWQDTAAFVKNWSPGTQVRLFEQSYLYSGGFYNYNYQLNASVTLDSISSILPGSETPQEQPSGASVPEPSTFMLLASGLGGFAMIRRFRRK